MSEHSTSNRRLARNSIFMSIRMVIVLVVSLYTTRVVLDVLGVANYGVYNVVAGFVLMFTFLNSSMSSATQRFYNVELGKNGVSGARLVYCASFRIHLIIGLIIVAVTEVFGMWYIPNKMVLPQGQLYSALWIFHFSVISLFLNVIYTPYMASVMAHERMDFYAGVEILNTFLKLGMAFVLPVIPGNKLIWYGFYNMSISGLILVLYLFYSRRHFKEIRLGAAVPRDMFREMLSFSGWNIFGAIAYTLRDQGVNLVLNAFFGTIVNAARGVTNQVNGALTGFTSSITTPARPQMIQSYSRGEVERAWRITFTISKVSVLFFYMMALPIGFEISFILKLWLGNEVPEYTSSFVALLFVVNIIGSLQMPISTMVHASGKMKYYQIFSSISNLMTVPLAYILIKHTEYPPIVYMSLLITTITTLIVGVVSAKRLAYLQIRDYCKRVIVPVSIVIAISCPIGLLITYLFSVGWERFVCQLTICPGIIIVLSYFLAADKGEKSFVLGVIRSIKSKFISH